MIYKEDEESKIEIQQFLTWVFFSSSFLQITTTGTIMHSLDHSQLEWTMEDVLWLDVNHPKFARMAEMARVVVSGFTSDIPGLLFHRRYKGSNHPFYETIYKKAASINVGLADAMDTCIIK